MMTMSNTYTLPIQTDENNEPFIVFPEDEMVRLGWKEGDILDWKDNKDGSWTLTKKENMDFVEKILQFNRIAGKTGETFDARDTSLYIGLILEEVAELIESIPDQRNLGRLRVALEYNSKLFKEGFFDKQVADINRVDALDACVDISVVSIGGANALGTDTQSACHNVADSNLSKFTLDENGDYVVLRDANGKIKKPAEYKAPELAQFLK